MPRKIELESKLEDRCVAKVEALGGMALKLSIPSVRGFPDRTILLPSLWRRPPDPIGPTGKLLDHGRVFFAEFKRLRTGKVSAQQRRWRVLLHQMGFGVYLIDTDAEFDEALEKETSR